MDTKPLTVAPTHPQIQKLIEERVMASAIRRGVGSDIFQLAMGMIGTELEDTIVSKIVELSKRARGIATPLPATETGLLPEGWTVEEDDLEGDINLAELDFNHCPVKADEEYIEGSTMEKRAVKLEGLIGSLGFAKIVLDAQKERKDIIPPELRGKVYIICTRTKVRDSGRSRRVACLRWGGEEWVLGCRWLDYDFYRHDRLPRVRKSLAA